MKALDKKTKKIIMEFQRSEITEYFVYKALSRFAKLEHNRMVMKKISDEELRHYHIWHSYSGEKVKPDNIKRWFYVVVSAVFGVTARPFAEWQRNLGTYVCGGKAIHDIQVRRCVLWNDWGKALEIGIETVADEIRDVVFEDCDIIHVSYAAMDVTTHDRATCKNILFRNIRVEFDDDFTLPQCLDRNQHFYPLQPWDKERPFLFTLSVGQGYVTVDTARGHIEDVSFENIEVTARQTRRVH